MHGHGTPHPTHPPARTHSPTHHCPLRHSSLLQLQTSSVQSQRMAEGGSSTAAPRAPPCCGLARLVRRLRRQGRRALCAAAAASHSHQPRRHRASSCRQYDPLSYARNFDLGPDADDADDARIYYACSFSSRFALVPAAAASSSSAAPAGLGSLPVAATS